MAKHILTGVNTEQRSARMIGVVFLLAITLAVTAWMVVPSGDDTPTGQMTVTLVTETVGAGVEQGTEVWRNGVKVGSVTAIARAADGQHITVDVDSDDVRGLTDDLSLDFAPANLFGITQITLNPGAGGSPLADGTTVTLTGTNSDRVRDATMTVLLGGLGQVTNEVLTPKLAHLVEQLANNSKEFTPMLQTIVGVSATVWQTQTMPYSPVLRGFGEGFRGLPPTLSGILNLLDVVYQQPYLKSAENRAKFNATTDMLANGLIPSVAGLLGAIQPYYQPLADMPVPLLNALAESIGTSKQTAADARALLDRLSRSFHDSPAGPVLDLAVAINVGGSVGQTASATGTPGTSGAAGATGTTGTGPGR